MKDKEWEKSASFFEACEHALDGVKFILKKERNLRILLVGFVIAIGLAWVLKLSAVEYAVIVLVSAAIVAAEMFNTSLEVLEDIVWPEYRAAIKVSKDLAAGAVLVLSGAAVVIGGFLFLPPLVELL